MSIQDINTPICPYCSHVEAKHNIEDNSKIICSKCGKPYNVVVNTIRKFDSEPLDSFMEHGGYLITQTSKNKFVFSKVIDEFDTKSEALDALLDNITLQDKDDVVEEIKEVETVASDTIINKFF